jgi:hypothetical protein
MTPPDTDKKLESLQARKEALRKELEELEGKLESGIHNLQDDVSDRFKPVWWIKKYPLRAVGTAVLIGFLAGNRDKSGALAGATVTASVVAALKTFAARKLVDQIIDMLENKDNSKS